MIKSKAKLTVNGKAVFEKEDRFFSAVHEAEKSVAHHLYNELYHRNSSGVWVQPAEGDKGKMTVVIEWECTMNRRAAPRAKAVIAAEKAARAVKVAAKQVRNAQYEQERLRRAENIRVRIQNQINHAFAVGAGKTGSDSVGKYITCVHCDAAAVLLTLKTPMPKGAHMLDEDLINGALCETHKGANTHGWGRNAVTYETVRCSRLEFLYDGVRAIAFKPETTWKSLLTNAMPTPEQIDAYRKKIGPYTEQLTPSVGVGKTQKMRAFMIKMSGGTQPQNMTTKQWDEVIGWMESYAAQYGMSKLIANIEAVVTT